MPWRGWRGQKKRRPLVFHRDVEEEVDEAYHWYEGRRTGLGEGFLSAVEEVYLKLQDNPKGHPVIYRNVRRASTRRFPYGVFDRLQADRIEVIAVQHSRQGSWHWKARIS